MGINQLMLPRGVRHFDWLLLGFIFGLTAIGYGMVYSATLPLGIADRLVMKQVVAGIIGLMGFCLLASVNYQQFPRWVWWFYGGSLGLLGAVLVAGVRIHRTKGWFAWGPVSFQPAELAPVVMVVVLAVHLDRFWQTRHRVMLLWQSALLVLGHVALILLQPDVSGCLVYFPILLTLWFCMGANGWYLFSVLIYVGTVLGIPLAVTLLEPSNSVWLKALQGTARWPTVALGGGVCAMILLGWWVLTRWRVRIPAVYPLSLCGILLAGYCSGIVVQRALKEYQRERLIVFANPDADPLGAGYNLLQAKIAIGSGRLLGRGYLAGTQSRLGFLPAQHTDFIFAVLAEEMGFFRTIGILALIGG
ncbi:MAG: FtsW/RodA/SpoVE family cell cycle protein, partial [Elusimicrobia bacterium]|nr:FtsW/RodA/SpoVE family cell cycle protein [Elusimicrobiota bacterium]